MADKEIAGGAVNLTDGGAAASGDKVHAFRSPNSRAVTLGALAGISTILTTHIGDAQVSAAKMADLAAVSVLGRSANSSGVMAAIAAAANDRLLARVSDSLAFQELTIGMVPDALLTYAKLATAAIGTEAEIKSAAASKLLSVAAMWGAMDDVAALTDAATVAVDMSTIMSLTSVSIGGNRTLGNPSSVKAGQGWGMAITASGATRTMAKGTNYKSTGGATWPLSIASGETAYVFFYNWSSSITLVTAVYNNPT